jgi:phospholipase/carboxylesterase
MNLHISTSLHGEYPVLMAGDQHNPTQILLLIHGRGATAENILSVLEHITVPAHTAIVVPQAAQNTWYPNRFLVPQQDNQPYLSAALERVHTLIEAVTVQYGLATEHCVLAGFSQGACLVAEYLKRYPRRYQAALVWSGGLIGIDDEVLQEVPGSLAGTPVYLGCATTDEHIPFSRVTTSATYFTDHGALVTLDRYEYYGHAIHPQGLHFLQQVLD